MKRYPDVMGELETMRLVVSGRSIARYGDGELKMADRMAGIKSQDYHPVLRQRLREILRESGACLIGIPNIHAVLRAYVSDQKVKHWSNYLEMAHLLGDREFVSAFITRPDSAPWIHTPEYWALVESLWRDQDVLLVRGSGKSLTVDDVATARCVTEIIAPRRCAFDEYDSILSRIEAAGIERVLIGLGPTATVLAVDLCRRGFHAVDLGHLAMFLRKFRRGDGDTQLSHDEKYQEMPA